MNLKFAVVAELAGRACLRCMYPKGLEVQVLSTAPLLWLTSGMIVFYSSLAEPKKRDISTLRGADNRVSQTSPLDRIEGNLRHLFSNSEIDARQVQLL